MPIVRLSGHVEGKTDPNRKTRARLLYRLYDAGWDIYNGNGDQVITLGNIQKKILESDAFVFTPGAKLEDMFQAASIFVGHQTKDKDLSGKPTAIQNSDGSWDCFLDLIAHLHEQGTVKQLASDFLTIVQRPKAVLEVLDEDNQYDNRHTPTPEPDIFTDTADRCAGGVCVPRPKYNVCVFCSASIKKEDYLQQGYDLGAAFTKEGWGCVSGAGKTGIMGKVVAGSVETGGWAAGSNVPHIIALEGLPGGLSEFWPRGDIYTRMEVMIERSDAFIIMPGGIGTVQEVLALVLLKQQKHALMQNKPVMIVNRPTENGTRFWQPLVELLQQHGAADMFTVVDSPEDAVVAIRQKIAG